MCKFSVIVPVYKVELSLPRCIESIINQTVTDFELILIDDGSPDRSGEICDEYAAKDSRIRVIHQKNGGVSRARNAGLDIARGEYIVFVDSDDWVDANYLECFDKNNTDLCICGQKIHGINGTIEKTINNTELITQLHTESDIVHFFNQWYAIMVWGKCFSHSIIKTNNIRFDESICYGEDTIFVAEYVRFISTVYTTRIASYNFQKTTSESLSKLDDQKWYASFASAQEKIYTLYTDYEKVQFFLAGKFCWAAELELAKISQHPWPLTQKIKAARQLLQNKHLSVCNKVVGKRNSLTTRLVFMSRNPHFAVWFYGRSKRNEA